MNCTLPQTFDNECCWETVIKNGKYDLSTPNDWVIDKLLKYRRTGISTFLDLGCGLGRHLKPMIGQYKTCVGFDISDSSIRKTAQTLTESDEKFTLNMVRGHFNHLPFRDKAFETILAWRCIYLQDMNGIIKSIHEIKRILSPGGHFICSVRSTSNSLYYLGKEIGKEIEKNTFFFNNNMFPGLTYHFFTKGEILKLVREFQIVEILNTTLSNTIFSQNVQIHKNDFWILILRNKDNVTNESNTY